MCLSVVGHLQNIRAPPLPPLHPFNRLISAMCLTRLVCCAAAGVYACGVGVSPLHASVCVCFVHSQVFVPYALCPPARDSVTVGMCGRSRFRCYLHCPVCALSLSASATYLFVAHLCCAGPDTGVCQQREERNVGNW